MDQVTSDLDRLARAAADRKLTTPLLLFLAGHRPLAFFAGQALYMAAPLVALVGGRRADAWADLLSAPDALHTIEMALLAATRLEQHDLE